MKLRARTLAGVDLRIPVRLTGYLREFSSGAIDRVEIYMPPRACVECDETEHDELRLRLCLWAEPRDLCADDGGTISHEDLRAEAARVLEQQRVNALRGPLGENWP